MTLQLHSWVFTPSEKKGHMYPNVYSSKSYNCQTVERAKMPFNRQMDKDVVHIYNGIILSH